MRNDVRSNFLRAPTRVALLLVAGISVAHAEPRARSADAQVAQVGRRRFTEGVAALKSGKYEEARLSFQQSYALKPAPAALRNLAAAELKTGRYVEAARHFTTYLKTTKSSEIEHPEVLQRGLADAKSHCGMLVVEANVPGAEIVVDGETIGRTPMNGEAWLGEPGERQLMVRLDGYEEHLQTAKLEAGRTIEFSVDLRVKGAPKVATATPVESAPVPTLASSSEGRFSDDVEPSPSPSLRPSPPVYEEPPAPQRVSGVPIIIGTVVTMGALGAGIAYTVASNSNASDRDALLAGIPGTSPKCGSGNPNENWCDQVRKLDDDSIKQRNLATAGFVVAGVAGAATLAYWLWPRSPRSQAVIVPAVAPTFAGFQMRSSF